MNAVQQVEGKTHRTKGPEQRIQNVDKYSTKLQNSCGSADETCPTSIAASYLLLREKYLCYKAGERRPGVGVLSSARSCLSLSLSPPSDLLLPSADVHLSAPLRRARRAGVTDAPVRETLALSSRLSSPPSRPVSPLIMSSACPPCCLPSSRLV